MEEEEKKKKKEPEGGKKAEMTNSYTKETVSPVSKKQAARPSEQSLWNKDSLQTFGCNQSKSIQCLNCLNGACLEQQPFKRKPVGYLDVTVQV